MRRYYFKVFDASGEAEDDEGMVLATLDAAREHAIAGARSLMADSMRTGELDLSSRIEILDEDRAIVATVHFGDAVSINC